MSPLIPPVRPNVLSVAFATDNNYVDYLQVAIHSLLTHLDKKWLCDIIIMERELSPEKKRELLYFSGNYGNCLLRFLHMPSENQIQLNGHPINLAVSSPIITHITLATYYRLFLANILPNYDKILYLDIDILIQGDLAQLFRIDLKDSYLVACPAPFTFRSTYPDYAKNILKIPMTHRYFNAGILLLNLKKWREENLLSKALKIAQETPGRFFHDQCILNILSVGHLQYFSPVWNYQITNCGILNFRLKPGVHPQIVHFIGGVKPWNCKENPFTHTWWETWREINTTK